MSDQIDHDVLVIGDGPAGLSAALFTARAGLPTTIVSDGESILRRNAHLENYPGFPAGVNGRLLLDLMADQAERAGCDPREGRVVDLAVADREGDADGDGHGFLAETAAGDELAARSVIAATKNTVDFLDGIEGVGVVERGKTFVDTVDDRGRTGVPGLYAAGRLAMEPYQTIVVAGHGASVGLAVIEDSEVPFYHDWVVPDRYFTGRGRDLPPGCAEIDAAERERRERESLAVMREYLAEPHPDEPIQHPSVRED